MLLIIMNISYAIVHNLRAIDEKLSKGVFPPKGTETQSSGRVPDLIELCDRKRELEDMAKVMNIANRSDA